MVKAAAQSPPQQGLSASEEYAGVASTCRNGERKANAFKVETSNGDE